MATGWGGITTGSTSFDSSLTFAGPAVAGSDTVGYVAVVSYAFETRDISGVTWDGAAMTPVGELDDGFYSIHVFQKTSPASGGSVVITNAAFGSMAAAAFYLTGNEQATPATGAQTDTDYGGTGLSATVASVADALVIGVFGFSRPSRTFTAGASQTVRTPTPTQSGTDGTDVQIVVTTEAGSASVITDASFTNPLGDNDYLYAFSANPSVAAAALGGAGAHLRRLRWMAA